MIISNGWMNLVIKSFTGTCFCLFVKQLAAKKLTLHEQFRSELRRFMRNIKRSNPSVNCVLQYDKLVVDNKIFVWNDIQVSNGWCYLKNVSTKINTIWRVKLLNRHQKDQELHQVQTHVPVQDLLQSWQTVASIHHYLYEICKIKN